MTQPIYLDHQATTPTDPRVSEALVEHLKVERVGNPHSEHVAGRQNAAAVERAREQLATLIGALPQEIYFTSGATEANNLALQGVVRSVERRGDHIVTCVTEHKCVLGVASFLQRSGFALDILPVDDQGRVSAAAVSKAIRRDTAFVSIMMANNELGVLHPVADIAAACRSAGVPFHCDAAQAVGKVPINVKELGIDLMSVSGHKMYAPMGIGALYVSEDSPVRPEPLFWGGGQEAGLRSGTVATPLCVALGEAAAIATKELVSEMSRLADLRARFVRAIQTGFPSVRVNAGDAPRVPGTLSLTFPGVDADRLIGSVQPALAISRSSACTAGMPHASHVLLAIGMSPEDADCTVRFGFGRFNDERQVARAAELVATAASRILRGELQPARQAAFG